nr:uncharacterized protein LOC108945337 [Nicotiana tomentosiformis]
MQSVLHEMQLDSTEFVDALEISDATAITSALDSVDTNTKVANIVKSHLDSQLPVFAVGDTIPKTMVPDGVFYAYISVPQLQSSPLSFSVKRPSLPLKACGQELDMEFGCKVFDILPKRNIFVHFHGNNRTISSLPYDFGFHDCKWVDIGQVRVSDDAKTEETTLKDTTDSAAIDCTSDNRFDLIVENSLLLDNSEALSEMLQNPIADSLPGYSAILGHQLFDTMSNRHCYSKSCEVVCAALSIDYSAEVQDELKEIVHYLHDPKRCTRLNGLFANTVLFTCFLETGNTILARTLAGVVTMRMLLNFPFDFGSDDGHSHNITKMFDNSFQSDLPLIGCPTSESKLIGWFYLAKRLAAGEWITVRVPACGLFHIAYSNASDMLTVDLLSTYSQMCQEDMPVVRRLVATHLGKFVATVAPTYLKIDIMSMFDYLTHGAKILVSVVALDILSTRLLLAFGAKPYSGIYEKTSSSLKDQLEAITPALEKVSDAPGSIKNHEFLEYLKKFLDWSVQSEAVSNTGSLIGCSVNDLVLALSTYGIQVGNGKQQKRGEPFVEISEEDCGQG